MSLVFVRPISGRPEWCMCIRASQAERTEAIRENAHSASSTLRAAAARNPRENAATTPVGLAKLPAVVATADSTATPRAAPTS